MIKNKVLGKIGEKTASSYLNSKGYVILEKNYSCRLGEIDIIAKKGRDLIFIEVKTRTNLNYGYPEESVSGFKIKKIKDVAKFFIANNNSFSNFNFRFDVISIIVDKNLAESILCDDIIKNNDIKKIFSSAGSKFEHIKDAF